MLFRLPLKDEANAKPGGFGVGLDFHFRYARFCISTYALRFITLAGTPLTRTQRESVKYCVDCAASVLNLILDLNPVHKDGTRYMSDFGFVMLAFACLFILQAYQTIEIVLEERVEKLDLVAAMAQLMIELGPASDHCAVLYGRSLQQRLKNIHQQNEKLSNEDQRRNGLDSATASLDSSSTAHSIEVDHFGGFMTGEDYQIDLSWEPSALFSDFLNDISTVGYA